MNQSTVSPHWSSSVPESHPDRILQELGISGIPPCTVRIDFANRLLRVRLTKAITCVSQSNNSVVPTTIEQTEQIQNENAKT